MDGVLRDQREYYDARAAEYDDAYERTAKHDRGDANNAEWRVEMAQLASAFDALTWSGDVVELAAGTGFWTERIAKRAESLTVIDGSAAMLALNRQRLGAVAASVHYEIADLLAWRPTRSWDVCVFAFWLCHVPDDRVAAFLRIIEHPRPPATLIDACANAGLTITVETIGTRFCLAHGSRE